MWWWPALWRRQGRCGRAGEGCGCCACWPRVRTWLWTWRGQAWCRARSGRRSRPPLRRASPALRRTKRPGAVRALHHGQCAPAFPCSGRGSHLLNGRKLGQPGGRYHVFIEQSHCAPSALAWSLSMYGQSMPTLFPSAAALALAFAAAALELSFPIEVRCGSRQLANLRRSGLDVSQDAPGRLACTSCRDGCRGRCEAGGERSPDSAPRPFAPSINSKNL